MAHATDWLENELIKHLFRTGSMSKPTALYIGLNTVLGSDASPTGTEVTATGYSRINVPPLDANWAATSGTNGMTSNVSAINFGTWTTGPTTVLGLFIGDASSGGNILFTGPLTASKTVAANDSFSIPANQLTITVA